MNNFTTRIYNKHIHLHTLINNKFNLKFLIFKIVYYEQTNETKKMQEVHQYVNAYVLFALGMGAKYSNGNCIG